MLIEGIMNMHVGGGFSSSFGGVEASVHEGTLEGVKIKGIVGTGNDMYIPTLAIKLINMEG